jgi:hypothetical protein
VNLAAGRRRSCGGVGMGRSRSGGDAEEAVKAGGRADWEERGFATADARELM